MLCSDCVISVGGRNYFGKDAALIVFEAIQTKRSQGTLKYVIQGVERLETAKSGALEKAKLYREYGLYSHKNQKQKQYFCTWKKEETKDLLFILQW
eukprot:UN30662